jgi:hypothetical protein
MAVAASRQLVNTMSVGTMQATVKFKGATFPAGRSVISRDVPGARVSGTPVREGPQHRGTTLPCSQTTLILPVLAHPGVIKASIIMAAADVGASMDRPLTYLQRFLPSDDATANTVVPDTYAPCCACNRLCCIQAYPVMVCCPRRRRRAFNVQQQVDGCLGYAAVRSVELSADPARLVCALALSSHAPACST